MAYLSAFGSIPPSATSTADATSGYGTMAALLRMKAGGCDSLWDNEG